MILADATASECGGRVTILRDSLGIPHVRASCMQDAFFGQGYAHAEDRLWQMDYDRRRGYGRCSEVVGESALAQDILMRRMQLAASCRNDYADLEPSTRAMLDAYAHGVNRFICSMTRLPLEYELTQTSPERWQPWDGLVVYKVRHVNMGVWERKMWRARLGCRLGVEALQQLYPDTASGELLVLPPGALFEPGREQPADSLPDHLDSIDWLKHAEGGSNNWVIGGSRTQSGKPLMAGDPHRAVDVPNVYYQNHVACDEFDVIGLSFPGLPGFPHFGHNGRVAWCITHVGADTQDLFVETFHPGDPSLYLFKSEWLKADSRRESIRVKDRHSVEIEVRSTHHGPIIKEHQNRAIALAYTAFMPNNTGWDSMLKMLYARSCDELDESMRGWVDPVNNMLYADSQGNFGYRMRGKLPVRDWQNAWLPVEAHTGKHEWQRMVPFDDMASCRNPESDYLLTANNRVTDASYPHYISLEYASDHRAQRIKYRIEESERFSANQMIDIHRDIVSLPALRLLPLLKSVVPKSETARRAMRHVSCWDGSMHKSSVAASVYSATREELLEILLSPMIGSLAEYAFGTDDPGSASLLSRFRSRLSHELLSRPDADQLLQISFDRAIESLRTQLGDNPDHWQWGRLHTLHPEHPLSASLPEAAPRLNPCVSQMGGDADTVQAAPYRTTSRFGVVAASCARYVFDTADWNNSAWVVPYGASGDPRSAHYDDQHPLWLNHTLAPMLYDWTQIAREAESRLVLDR